VRSGAAPRHRPAGQDELLDAEGGVLVDPGGDLGIAADERGAGAFADQTDPGPEVRRDGQGVHGVRTATRVDAAVQVRHGPLADRVHPGEPALGRADSLRIHAGEQPGGVLPCLLSGFPGDHVQP
jgi:hypothetical protein